MKLRLIGLLMILLFSTSCSSEERLPVREIFDAYILSLNSGDIESVMDLFADNATFQTYEDNIIVGKENIQEYLQSMIDEGIHIESEVTNIAAGAELHAREEITLNDSTITHSVTYTFAFGKITGYVWW
jgi:ketosteroid isomerase-like protein